MATLRFPYCIVDEATQSVEPETNSWAVMPATAIIARRPLFSSLSERTDGVAPEGVSKREVDPSQGKGRLRFGQTYRVVVFGIPGDVPCMARNSFSSAGFTPKGSNFRSPGR